jgi:outer membrane cobalamin receptor
MRNNRVLLFLLFFSFSLQAQVSKREPLRVALKKLESQFNVVFTYADEWVDGVEVESSASQKSLQTSLEGLSKQTNLLFRLLGNRYIIITRKETKSDNLICVSLRSSETGEPIVGATIQSDQSNTVTDEAGNFRLNQSSGSIVIRSVGFESLILPVNELAGDCQPVLLKPAYTLLQEVTVTDIMVAGIEKKADGAITLRPQVMGIMPGLPQQDAIQNLQFLPGVRSISEAAADLNIRGGTNDQNLVLLDGIRVYQTGHFFGLLSGLNPHIISKLSLIKNGSSAYYGEGVSGTVVIQSDDQVKNKLSGSAGVNLLYTDINAFIPVSKKISVEVATRRSLPSSWQTPTYKQYFNRAFSNTEVSDPTAFSRNQNFYFFDTYLKFLYDLNNRNKIRISFFNVSNLLEYEEQAVTTNEQKKSSLRQQSLGSSINYTRLWNDKLKTNLEGFVSGYSLRAINQDIAANQQLTQDNEVLDVGLRFSATAHLTNALMLQGGYQFFESGITNADAINNPDFSRLSKEVNRTHAFFTEANLTDQKELTHIRAGVRLNAYSKTRDFFVEPRLVINRKITDSFSVDVQGEYKTQTSVQIIDLQNDFLGVEKRRWLMANGADVPVLQSRQISLGLNYNYKSWLLTMDGYAKQVTGIITSSQGFQNQFQFIRSAGSYRTRGVDALANYKTPKLQVWIGSSISRSDYEFPVLIPPAFPNNLDIRTGINGGFNYKIKQLEFSVGANWQSGRPTTIPVDNNEVVAGQINYGEPNAARLKNYLRLDMSARWNFYIGKSVQSQLGVSLWNILNSENILNQYYQVASGTQAISVEQLGLTFTPNFFVRVNF